MKERYGPDIWVGEVIGLEMVDSCQIIRTGNFRLHRLPENVRLVPVRTNSDDDNLDSDKSHQPSPEE